MCITLYGTPRWKLLWNYILGKSLTDMIVPDLEEESACKSYVKRLSQLSACLIFIFFFFQPRIIEEGESQWEQMFSPCRSKHSVLIRHSKIGKILKWKPQTICPPLFPYPIQPTPLPNPKHDLKSFTNIDKHVAVCKFHFWTSTLSFYVSPFLLVFMNYVILCMLF